MLHEVLEQLWLAIREHDPLPQSAVDSVLCLLKLVEGFEVSGSTHCELVWKFHILNLIVVRPLSCAAASSGAQPKIQGR